MEIHTTQTRFIAAMTLTLISGMCVGFLVSNFFSQHLYIAAVFTPPATIIGLWLGPIVYNRIVRT